jgi:hypothetical protein
MGLDQDILPRRTLGIPYGLDGGLVVGEYGALAGSDAGCLYVEHYLQC